MLGELSTSDYRLHIYNSKYKTDKLILFIILRTLEGEHMRINSKLNFMFLGDQLIIYMN